jgi:hypothetical protein
LDCGSGFCLHPDYAGPAAISLHCRNGDRGWRAAPTAKIKKPPQSAPLEYYGMSLRVYSLNFVYRAVLF